MNLTALIIVILLLSFLIFVHELGHFLAAKISGIYVKQFSIGFPPKIFGKKIGETEYVIGAIPFGGYVRLFGEDVEEKDESIPSERAFTNKPSLVKLFVLCSGVFMNVLVGLLLIMGVFIFAGRPVQRYAVSIDDVVTNSPAEMAHLAKGSFILGYKDVDTAVYTEPDNFDTFVNFIHSHLDTPFDIQVVPSLDVKERTYVQDVTVTPVALYEEGQGSLGVEIGWYTYTSFEDMSPLSIPGAALHESVDLVRQMVVGVKDIFASLIKGAVPDDVAGVVGIVVVSQSIFEQGLIPMLYFSAMISINLAVVNMLPFPALDGGRVLFVLLEMLFRRSLDNRVQQWIHVIGFAILMLLMVVVTYHDIIRFIL